ncbi:MAG: class I SAM-dependent methyltransferase [Verrucomicrobiota bacterium]
MEADDWYDTPLYYDIIFDADTKLEVDFLEWVSKEFGRTRRQGPLKVLEPACGSGRLMAEFARRGAKVSGFDLNPHMLEFASKRFSDEGLTGKLKQARLEDFSVRGAFDLAHCLVSTFKYIDSGKGARSHLECVARHLKTGGVYVLGLHLTDYEKPRAAHERWEEKRDGIKVVCNTRTQPAIKAKRTEDLRSRLRITEKRRTRTLETHWQFRTYNAGQIRRLLKSVPEFQLIACYDFHYDRDSPRKLDDSQEDIVLVLRKCG